MSPKCVVEDFKKYDEFTDYSLEVVMADVAGYLKVMVNEIWEMDPKFPLQEVKSRHDLMESAYAKDAPPTTAGDMGKAALGVENETATLKGPMP